MVGGMVFFTLLHVGRREGRRELEFDGWLGVVTVAVAVVDMIRYVLCLLYVCSNSNRLPCCR